MTRWCALAAVALILAAIFALALARVAPAMRDPLQFAAFWGYGIGTPLLAALGLQGSRRDRAAKLFRRVLASVLALWVMLLAFSLIITL